tara:strand:+ start:88 stop:501 length:414 start_codon:yes stop_codon:yes gene_type:complete
MRFKKRVKVERRKALLAAQNKKNTGNVAKTVENTGNTANLTENTLKTKKTELEKPQKAALEVKNTPNLTTSEPATTGADLGLENTTEGENLANTAEKPKKTRKKSTTTKKTGTTTKKTTTRTRKTKTKTEETTTKEG